MRYEYAVLTNEAATRFDGYGYRPGDRLVQTGMGSCLAETPAGAAGIVFGLFNRDDRPNGAFAPSMSVGDMVVLIEHTDARVHHYLAVQDIGFSPEREPAQIFSSEAFLASTS